MAVPTARPPALGAHQAAGGGGMVPSTFGSQAAVGVAQEELPAACRAAGTWLWLLLLGLGRWWDGGPWAPMPAAPLPGRRSSAGPHRAFCLHRFLVSF